MTRGAELNVAAKPAKIKPCIALPRDFAFVGGTGHLAPVTWDWSRGLGLSGLVS
jgi:hypothetical protein